MKRISKTQIPAEEYEIHGVYAEVSENRGARLFGRLLQSELFMDALSCFLLSAGALTALLAMTELSKRPLECLIVSLVSLVLLILTGRKWWVLPSVFAGLFLFYLLYLALFGDPGAAFSYWQEFATWILSGAPYSKGLTDPGFMAAIFVIVVFSVVLVFYLLIRRLFFFPALLIVSAVALFFSYSQTRDDLSAALCLSAAGLIVLLPRVYYRQLVEKVDAAGRSSLSRARMQFVAVFAAVFAILLSLLFVPQDTQRWKSEKLVLYANDIGALIKGPFNYWPEIRSGFNLGYMGFTGQTERLGGPVELGDEVFLSVWADEPQLLKGRIYDYYDQNKWSVSTMDGDLRLNSFLWNKIRDEAFDLDKPAGGAAASLLYEQLTADTTVTINDEHGKFNTVFAPINTWSVTFGNNSPYLEVFFNRRSELYTRYLIRAGQSYTLQARTWNTDAEDFDKLFVRLEASAGKPQDYPEIYERYTQLPETLPEEVWRTAGIITEGVGPAYLKALEISKWLGKNMSYTLTPGIPPEDADFTAHFLETREGHCVYFATAMTVLARCEGMPARYVEGFALEPAPEGGYYQATGRTAHAWSEVYFPGIGWMPFDALKWNPDSHLNSSAPAASQDEDTQADHSYSSHETANQDGLTAEGYGQKTRAYAWLFYPLMIPVFYGLFRWVLWAGPRYMIRRWAYKGICRRAPGTAGQLGAVYLDTLKLLSLLGLGIQPGETLITFPKRIDCAIVFKDMKLSEMADVLMRSHFGNEEVNDNEVERACLYHSLLEARVLEHLGKVRYLFKRILLIAAAVCMVQLQKHESQ